MWLLYVISCQRFCFAIKLMAVIFHDILIISLSLVLYVSAVDTKSVWIDMPANDVILCILFIIICIFDGAMLK